MPRFDFKLSTLEQSKWLLLEVDIGCTKQVARIIKCNDYTNSTLKTRFQSTGTLKCRPVPEKIYMQNFNEIEIRFLY